jgi:hypothetical protein
LHSITRFYVSSAGAHAQFFQPGGNFQPAFFQLGGLVVTGFQASAKVCDFGGRQWLGEPLLQVGPLCNQGRQALVDLFELAFQGACFFCQLLSCLGILLALLFCVDCGFGIILASSAYLVCASSY